MPLLLHLLLQLRQTRLQLLRCRLLGRHSRARLLRQLLLCYALPRNSSLTLLLLLQSSDTTRQLRDLGLQLLRGLFVLLRVNNN